MALYSEQYQYHGLKKSDIRKIWDGLFSNYDLISNSHVFSAMKQVAQGKEARIEIIPSSDGFALSRAKGQWVICGCSEAYKSH